MEFDNDSVDVSGVQDVRGSGGACRAAGPRGRHRRRRRHRRPHRHRARPRPGRRRGSRPGRSTRTPRRLERSAGSVRRDRRPRSRRGAPPRAPSTQYVDCRLIKVYNVVNTTWRGVRPARRAVPEAGLASSPAPYTGCGKATAAGRARSTARPTQRIYFDLGFLQQLQQQFGAQGQFAQAYILAHEAGHHLQTLLGIEPADARASSSEPQSGQRACRCASSCRPTASPVCGPSSPTPTSGKASSLTRADVEEALERGRGRR